MKKLRSYSAILSTCLLLLLSTGCTDLDEHVYDKYDAEQFYSTTVGGNAALANVLQQLSGNWGANYAGYDNCWYDVNSFTADEQVIPHRNTGDWQLDFAILYKHNWTPSTPGIINNVWTWLYASVFKANLAVQLLTDAKANASLIAEAKTMRAFYYYLLIDDFGDVPFYTENNLTVDKIPQKSRKEVFAFIEQELKENIDMLPETKGGAYYGRFNKWAGYMLLAKLYLNAEVYTGTARWADCLAACNKISQGGFSLHPGNTNTSAALGNTYFELFGDVLPADETILAMANTAGVSGNLIYTNRTLIGEDNVEGYPEKLNGWNGTIVMKEYVDKYDTTDVRRKQYRYGLQKSGVNYSPIVTNIDNPGAGRFDGIRCVKFYPAGKFNFTASNDFPIYRYSDVVLMKAECNVRMGNAAAAKPDVDAIRKRAGLNALAAAPTLMDIYDERGFELNWEGHRRQDMIRFATFTKAHDLKAVSADFRKLFPIPTAALNANPLLKQNPGY